LQPGVTDSLVRKLLAVAIRFYRERLSGRGPFQRVSCTFDRCESCSAYGERMVQEAATCREALARIRRRLQRCRSLSLFRFPDGKLGHASGYDGMLTHASPTRFLQSLDDKLAHDDESLQVRQAVRHAAWQIMAGEQGLQPNTNAMAGSPSLLVRDAVMAQHTLARRRRRAVFLAAVMAWFAVLIWAIQPEAGAAVFFVLGSILLARSAYMTGRLGQRLLDQETLNGLEHPWSAFVPVKVSESHHSRTGRVTP
jgi:putative component of membrane protein insertase Oxa1/YidC/SpoIIIJ protein YidD